MSYNIRYPKITASSDREQLVQIKSYLHQLVEQIQWAFDNIDSSIKVVTPTPTSLAPKKEATPIDAQATFDAIKGLIINSADIVNAYYEEINAMLEGEYVAQSDFGTFSELTLQELSATSKEIESLFSNIQSIVTDIENIEYTLIETNAHIKTGLLYYDDGEIPVYGLEIGQKNIVDGVEVFNKYARFTSGRLSFYDQNDTEVAYISDYKLYISNVEITSTYKIGGFVDTVTSNGDVVTKWVGRG